MSEKKINSRIINKHDIEAHWLLATNFIPKKGEIIVYDIEIDSDGNTLELPEDRTTPYTYERFKIGNGIDNVSDLPFVKDIKNLNDGKGNGALEQLHDDETWTGIDADGNEIAYTTEASGKFSAIYGGKSYAEGGRSLAGGTKSVAKGSGSLAFGDTNYAGAYATAFGYQTRALGAYSHTEGRQTITRESNAHAEGTLTEASGNSSHAEGQHTKATAEATHAEGYSTEALGSHSHAEGELTQANNLNSHAEGYVTRANGNNSHAEGAMTYANGDNSHAEGEGAVAGGTASHAEGTSTKASQNQAHAEGWNTEASGYHSHSEGSETLASGNFSHAGGKGTIASAEAQTSIGKYNRQDSNALFIIGNGTAVGSENNAFTVNIDGTATIQTSGTGDNNVVNYKQLTEYVANNAGGSEWDSQSEMLFSTGAVKINNSDDMLSYGENATLSRDGLRVDTFAEQYQGADLGLGYLTLKGSPNWAPRITLCSYIEKTGPYGESLDVDDTDLKLTPKEITQTDHINNKTYSTTWMDIINAANYVKNLIDVSTNGQ